MYLSKERKGLKVNINFGPEGQRSISKGTGSVVKRSRSGFEMEDVEY